MSLVERNSQRRLKFKRGGGEMKFFAVALVVLALPCSGMASLSNNEASDGMFIKQLSISEVKGILFAQNNICTEEDNPVCCRAGTYGTCVEDKQQCEDLGGDVVSSAPGCY